MVKSRLLQPLEKDRWFIMFVWLVGLFVNLVLVFYADNTEYRVRGVPPEHFREPINGLYLEVLASYAPYITTMLAIMFATKNRRTASESRHSWLFGTAFAISAVLNIIWVGQTFRVACLHTLDIQGLSEWLQGYLKNAAFLVNAFLAYYYSSAH
jgi:hypothetical protein